jgi:predicted oxidoreductase
MNVRNDRMKTYKIHKTDLEVSRIGQGCMKFGGRWDDTAYTNDDVRIAEKAFNMALEQGINFFDHADIYCKGKSERVFAEVLKESPGLRGKLIIQSKCGIRFNGDPNPEDPGRYDFSYSHITSSVEGILTRLNTDYLDILLLHRPDPLVEPEEVARAFNDLHQSGKVRYFGVSNHNAGQIALLQKDLNQPLVVNQVELSLLHAHMINAGIMWNIKDTPLPEAGGTLDYCRLNHLLIQAWGPVALGRLISPQKGVPDNEKETTRLIEHLAADKHVSKEAIALGWLLKHPAGIQPLIGTIRPARIKNSCQADTVTLSREEWYRLFNAARGKPVP